MKDLRLPVLALCLFATLGCTRRETAVEAGLRTRTLLVGNRDEPADLDPHVVFALTDQCIQMALFEGLTALDERTGQAVPAAAERWEASTDGLTWTFHLRAGLVWSNGDPLVADDFVQSFRRALLPAVASPSAYLYAPVKNADAFNSGKLTDPNALGFAAPDPRTVVVTVAQPTPILPIYAALPSWQPINPRVLARFGALDKRGPAWTRPGNLVGNGPFTLAEWTPNARIVVAKNPRYWDAARNRLERIIFFPFENSDLEERNFRAGQLHVTYTLPSARIDGHRRQMSDQLRIDPYFRVVYVNFNSRQPPFDNVKLRRALALAVDREALARVVFHGAAEPARSFTPPGCGGYLSRARVAMDYEGARLLLAEAGYPGGRDLPALALQTQNVSGFLELAEALQAMWRKELGVQVVIEPSDQRTFMQNVQNKSYLFSLSGWIADFADPVSLLCIFASDSNGNYTGWSSAAYDGLLNRAARTADAAVRLEIFQEAEALLLAETPVIPLVHTSKTFLLHPAVKGWEPAPIGLRRLQHVRLER